MANGFGGDITEQDPGMDSGPPDMGGGGAPGGPPGAGPPGANAPMGRPPGGPMLAAMARQAQGPQISAPGPGNMADSMNKIAGAIQIIQQALAGLPPGSKLHTDALGAVQRLSRHLGQGFQGPGQGVQQTMFGDMLRDTIKNFVAARIPGMMGGGGPGGPGGGQPPGPPTPSMPMPGA